MATLTMTTEGSSMPTSGVAKGSLYFLRRDPLYQQEKCFEFRGEPLGDLPKTNVRLEQHDDLQMHDVRAVDEKVTFNKHGFQLIDLQTKLNEADFEDENPKVAEVYLPEVAEALKRNLGASRVQIFDFVMRKRDPSFPVHNGSEYKYNQPSSIAHVDTTQGDASRVCQDMNPEVHKSDRWQYVNVWRPIKGPLNDWPLTLCDARSMAASDMVPRDVIGATDVTETYQVHRNQAQKWYFASDQMPNEAWMFLQADSRHGDTPCGVAHTSFDLAAPEGTALPRESIEVRAMVYYDSTPDK